MTAALMSPPVLRDEQTETLRGVSDDHRKVYALLVAAEHGMTRDQLAAATGLPDRRMRQVVEELRIIAAVTRHPRLGPLVLGFDPETQVYTVAKRREQADAIIAYHASRIRRMAAALEAQTRAADETFGQSEESRAVQGMLFDVRQVLSAWRGG